MEVNENLIVTGAITGVANALVIDTQTKFNTLVGTTGSNGTMMGGSFSYKTVIFDGINGAFTLDTANGGIQIPPSVTSILGYNNAIITVTNFSDSTTSYDKNGKAGIWYSTRTPDVLYRVSNLTVNCTLGSGYHVCAFLNCENMTNCFGFADGGDATSGTAGTNNAAFVDCNHLTGCSATCYTPFFSHAFGFWSCSDVSYSKGVASARGTSSSCAVFKECSSLAHTLALNDRLLAHTTYYGDYETGYESCSNMVGCRYEGREPISTHSGWWRAFYLCDHLSACKAEITTTGVQVSAADTLGNFCGYNNCNTLTSCTAVISYSFSTSTSGAKYATGFVYCKTMLSCSGSVTIAANGTGSNRAYGFAGCSGLQHCGGTGKATLATTNLGYGFYGDGITVVCRGLSFCHASDTGASEGASGTGTYTSNYCYVELDTATTVPANTAAGGFNITGTIN
jgi:hypothetical protein